MSKTSTVTARIAGENASFRLEREPEHVVWLLEGKIKKPLFAVFRDIAEGNWTTTVFNAILSSAHVGAPNRLAGSESALVKKALATNPPGLYAPLVAKVIEAYLFGLPEEEATFTDEASE